MQLVPKCGPLAPLDMSAWVFKGGFCTYALHTEISYTVHLEFFVRILFSWIALKDIFAMLKIHDYGMIYLYQSDFAMQK